MSDKLRTALKGGGRILISINVWANGNLHLSVTEEWARLTSPVQTVITADHLAAAEDQDAVIREELTRMVQKAHINYEAHKEEPPAPGADNTAQVVE